MDRVARVLQHVSAVERAQLRAPSVAAASGAGAGLDAPLPPDHADHFHDYAEVTKICEDLAAAYPATCKLSSIGTSREGREIW